MKNTLTSSLPVFLTDASTVSLSQGIKVLRSISSQEMPSCKILQVNRNGIEGGGMGCLLYNENHLFSIDTCLFHDCKLSTPTDKCYVTSLTNYLLRVCCEKIVGMVHSRTVLFLVVILVKLYL